MNNKTWRAALYIRLSREDYDAKNNIKEASDSVTAQRRILSEFVDEKADITAVDYYIDDGVSGSTSDRPEFNRMIADIERGLIDCVICKDSTRFMRNQAESIRYRDEFFPAKGVRYICVIDGIDRLPYQQKQIGEFLSDSIKDVFAEYYIAEGSAKIRNSLDNRRKNGLFIGSHTPYGYKKDPNNKNKLIVDEEAAEVVKQIFKWFVGGMSVSNIVRKLNQLGVSNPTFYKKEKGINVGNKATNNVWYNKTVNDILKNEVYIGNLVQGKNKKLSYKTKKCYAVPKEEQIRVENTHEAIIDKSTFESAQSMFQKGGHSSSKNNTDLFSGFIVCGDCGRKMSLKTNNHSYGDYRYYRCVTNSKVGLDICSKKPSIRVDVLEKAVLNYIQNMAKIAVDLETAIKELNSKANDNNGSSSLMRSLKKREDDLAKAEKEKMELFSSLSEGILTKEEYIEHKKFYNQKIEDLKKAIEQTKKDIDAVSAEDIENNEFVEHFKKYGKVDKLTRPMLNELVDSIVIFDRNNIEINFKFQDVFQNTIALLEAREQ